MTIFDREAPMARPSSTARHPHHLQVFVENFKGLAARRGEQMVLAAKLENKAYTDLTLALYEYCAAAPSKLAAADIKVLILE